MRRFAILALAFLAAAAPACYKYVPSETDARIERGKVIRVWLEQQADFRLIDITANGITQLSGEMIGWRSDSLGVSVFWLATPTGLEHSAQGETVLIGGDNIAKLETKEIDRARTTGFTAGLIALAGAAGVVVAQAGSDGEGDGNGPPDSE